MGCNYRQPISGGRGLFKHGGCRRGERKGAWVSHKSIEQKGGESSYLVRFLSLLPGALGGRLLQQGRDDVVGDVEELLVDLLVLAEVVVSDGGKSQ